MGIYYNHLGNPGKGSGEIVHEWSFLRHLIFPTNALEKGNFFVETVAKFGVIYIMLHFRSGMCKYTPCKINMEPTNHPFRKENDLKQTSMRTCSSRSSTGVYRAFHLNLSIRMPTLTTPTPSPRFFSSKLTNPQEKK